MALTATLSTGCATSGPVPATDYCLVSRFIWLSPGDALSDRTLRAILEHNETRAEICGPPPPADDTAAGDHQGEGDVAREG